jgi:hypothetical protein
MLPLVLVSVFLPAQEAAQPEAASRPRVFVAPLTGPNADPATLRLVEDRILVATRNAARGLDVVGARDVQSLLDAEAAQQALGCDTTSCANEIADALNAEQLVTGQLGRIGDTWQLSLTRSEHGTLKVLSRTQREARGPTAEGLLPLIEGQVRELFSAPEETLPVLTVVGGGVAGVAGAAALVGGALYGLSWLAYGEAADQIDSGDVPGAKQTAARGEQLYGTSLVVMIAGGAGVAVGAAVLAAGLALEGD